MTKRNQASGGNADKGPIERGANADRFGANGGAQDARKRELTERRQNDPGSLTEDEAKELATLEELGGVSEQRASGSDGQPAGAPNPGDPAPPAPVSEEARELNREVARESGIDPDRLQDAEGDARTGAGSDPAVDRSPEFDQSLDRDLNIEGLHDGPGGRKYLVLNLSDDQDALAAAKAYGEAVRQTKPELAVDLLRIAGVHVGRG